jgi:hypothetical protein
MTKTIREQRRLKFLELITADERTRVAGVALAAELLHVADHTVMAWLKPESAKSSNEIPLMAMELLEIKLKAMKKKRTRR